ncbi:hypothetical protein ACLOJK_000059 [Asimina triloba]
MKSCNCHALLFASLSSIIVVLLATCSASLAKDSLRGVAPQDEKLYKSAVIKCKDGSKKFTTDQLNDDFCDCPDGSDEPGTSACPDGKFYCRNSGHSPIILFSSKVNDGICDENLTGKYSDCCDGSDEYDGKAECPNTCWEAGKAAREKLKKKIATYQEGVIIRKKLVEQAKQAYAKEEEELSKLKNEEKILKGLVQKLKERKEQIEKAEELERLEKEKEEQRQRDAEKNSIEQEKKSAETPEDEMKDIIVEPPETLEKEKAEETPHDDDTRKIQTEEISHGDGMEEIHDEPHETSDQVEEDLDNAMIKDETGHDAGMGSGKSDNEDKHDDTEGLSREELGRRIASRWTGGNADQKTEEQDSKVVENDNTDIPDEAQDDEYDAYSSEDEDNRKNAYDEVEDDHVDDVDESHPSYDSDMEHRSDTTEVDCWDLDLIFVFSTVDHSDLKIGEPAKLFSVMREVQHFRFLYKAIARSTHFLVSNFTEAAQIRKEYDDSSKKLSKIQSRISSLTEKLKHDYGLLSPTDLLNFLLGLEKEFYSFYDHCFENKQNKYVYKPGKFTYKTTCICLHLDNCLHDLWSNLPSGLRSMLEDVSS